MRSLKRGAINRLANNTIVMTKLFRCNLGLGDAIALSGAAVVLAERHGGLIFPCVKKYEVSVRSFFVGYPEIEVRDVATASELWNTDADCIQAAEEQIPPRCEIDHYRWLYQKLGVDYEERWARCPIRWSRVKVDQIPIPRDKYVFLHDDSNRKFMIDDSRVPRFYTLYANPIEESILEFCHVIENADEVHVIDSAFFHLTEHLRPKGNLFLHRYARPYYPIWNDYLTRHQWTILE
jgi:hypothetical protein